MWLPKADRPASRSTTRRTCTSASAWAPTRSTSTRPRCSPPARRLHRLRRHRHPRRHRARFRALRLRLCLRLRPRLRRARRRPRSLVPTPAPVAASAPVAPPRALPPPPSPHSVGPALGEVETTATSGGAPRASADDSRPAERAVGCGWRIIRSRLPRIGAERRADDEHRACVVARCPARCTRGLAGGASCPTRGSTEGRGDRSPREPCRRRRSACCRRTDASHGLRATPRAAHLRRVSERVVATPDCARPAGPPTPRRVYAGRGSRAPNRPPEQAGRESATTYH